MYELGLTVLLFFTRLMKKYFSKAMMQEVAQCHSTIYLCRRRFTVFSQRALTWNSANAGSVATFTPAPLVMNSLSYVCFVRWQLLLSEYFASVSIYPSKHIHTYMLNMCMHISLCITYSVQKNCSMYGKSWKSHVEGIGRLWLVSIM